MDNPAMVVCLIKIKREEKSQLPSAVFQELRAAVLSVQQAQGSQLGGGDSSSCPGVNHPVPKAAGSRGSHSSRQQAAESGDRGALPQS